MMDGSAILKPALAKGTLRCLGCSRCARLRVCVVEVHACKCGFHACQNHNHRVTHHRQRSNAPSPPHTPKQSPDKFKKTVERDPALERRFQLVTVEPPGVEATTSILRGLRPRCACVGWSGAVGQRSAGGV
jgi:hypothetical protein